VILTHRLRIISIKNETILKYTVDGYVIKDGMITFYDKIDKISKSYPVNRVEIDHLGGLNE